MKFQTQFVRMTALAVSAVLMAAAPARAQSFEPIVRSVLQADLADAAGMDAWKEEIGKVAGGLAYIDWSLQNFMESLFLRDILPSGSSPLTDDAACQFLRDNPAAKLDLSERVDGNDNHLLLQLKADLGDLPDFAVIGCEALSGASGEGLRIRGFFYLPEIKIDTASQHMMLPITVDALRIPANTFAP